jgi:hypothetical protein
MILRLHLRYLKVKCGGNPQSGLFELKGYGSYGLSGVGLYACRGEAERAGMHAVPN